MHEPVPLTSITITPVIEVMFHNREINVYTICKTNFKRLNWKLRKLQKEGMTVIGIYFNEVHSTQLPMADHFPLAPFQISPFDRMTVPLAESYPKEIELPSGPTIEFTQ